MRHVFTLAIEGLIMVNSVRGAAVRNHVGMANSSAMAIRYCHESSVVTTVAPVVLHDWYVTKRREK